MAFSGAGLPARHILLTGPQGVGKTTLIHKVCRALQEQSVLVQGFYTEEQRAHGKRTGFDVVTLDGQRAPLARVKTQTEPTRGREYRVGQYTVELHSFENAALPTLRQKDPASRPVLVVDEIGKMELFSESFKTTIRDILKKKHTTVLATIPVPKGRPIPFVEEVRGHREAHVFTISRDNRDSILADIVKMVMDSHKHYGHH